MYAELQRFVGEVFPDNSTSPSQMRRCGVVGFLLSSRAARDDSFALFSCFFCVVENIECSCWMPILKRKNKRLRTNSNVVGNDGDDTGSFTG